MKSVEYKSAEERTRILESITTPYDEFLIGEEPDSQYYLDLIKLKIVLGTNLISLKDINAIQTNLHKEAEAVNVVFIPLYEPWSEEMINRIVENLNYLNKNRSMSAKTLHSAVLDVLGYKRPHRVPMGSEALVLKHFVMNPMSTFKDAASNLSLHRSTVYDAYKKLETHHWARVLGHNNVTAFGMQPIYLIFELKDPSSWDQIESCFQSFPFTSRVLKYANSPTIISAFLLPNSSSNLHIFKAGVKKISNEFFSYSSLHFYEGSGRLMNPTLMQNGEWLMPECVNQKDLYVKSPEPSFIAATEKSESMSNLTFVDFQLEEILCMNPRMKPSEANKHLDAQGHTMPTRMITERKRLFIEHGILTPFLWFARLGFHYDIPVEVVCDVDTRDRILEILTGFPLIYLYFKSNRGVIFWLETPQTHLPDYLWFLNALQEMKGVRSVKSILAIMYRGGRPNKDIMEGYEYGDDGFLTCSSDVDIAAYLD